jgi:DNA-binding transcriptional ArsR family regulator
VLPTDDLLEEARTLFSALADGTRLKIVLALSETGELCVCDVAHVLGVSISTASFHLRKLRDLRVLKFRNDGKMAYYSVRDKLASKIVAEALDQITA